jgi:hypothetical protein
LEPGTCYTITIIKIREIETRGCFSCIWHVFTNTFIFNLTVVNYCPYIFVQDSTFTGLGKRKTLKILVYPKMEKALYKWFLKQREQHAPINGDMINEKAKTLDAKFYESSFRASNGWLQTFKKRYGIRFLKIAGEKLSSQPELIAPFKEKLSKKVTELQLSLEQIYNADESGLEAPP